MATAPAGGGGGGGDSQVLREYLVALGFRIDERRSRNFRNTLGVLDRGANKLGQTLVAAGTAAVTMAVLFTRSMERLFYNARYADTTVAKLQEMEFAGRNIGLAGGEMTQGLKSMAGALRANPGLVGMLNKLGVPVTGRDMSDVMWDFVRATKSMPFYVAQQYAEMFGISPEMLFNMQKGEEEARAAMERRRQMAGELGADADKLAESSKEAANIWRDLSEYATVFGQAVLSDAMPQVRELAAVSKEVMKDWKQISTDIQVKGNSQFWSRIAEGLGYTGTPGTRAELTPNAGVRANIHKNRLRGMDADFKRKGAGGVGTVDDNTPEGAYGPPIPYDPSEDVPESAWGAPIPYTPDADEDIPEGAYGPPQDVFDPQEHLRMLERKYKLPPGILGRIWTRESSRGKNMLSPKGARGHFGFMPATAKQYGIAGKEDDFIESSDAAGRMMRDMLKETGGDVRAAAAAYNWGIGNVKRLGVERSPDETKGYMDYVGGPGGVNVNTDITINGATDPARTAELVKQKQSDVAGSVVRNMSPRVR